MSRHARVEVEGQVVIATFCGVVDESGYREVRDRVARSLRENGLSRVIMDLSGAVLDASAMSIFSVAASNPDVIPKGVRYAVVYSPDTVPSEGARFGENVARNRGAGLRTFTDLQAARAWVESDNQ